MNKEDVRDPVLQETPCRKGVQYGEKDFDALSDLLNDPVLRDAVPKKIRHKRNQVVLWCVKEFVTILHNRLTAHQTSLNFTEGEVEDLHQKVDRLQATTEKILQSIEDSQKKKTSWWNR